MKAYNIIRIEHKDGFGMFRTNWGSEYKNKYTIGDSKETAAMYNRHNLLPTPWRDGIKDFDTYDMYCAFNDLKTFNKLVKKEELKFLFKKGYKVLLITVSKRLKGKWQVAYKKEDILTTTNISSLFK